ncbi:hypothetical protein ACFQV8_06675 [Pseudonocardia benzenivorans]
MFVSHHLDAEIFLHRDRLLADAEEFRLARLARAARRRRRRAATTDPAPAAALAPAADIGPATEPGPTAAVAAPATPGTRVGPGPPPAPGTRPAPAHGGAPPRRAAHRTRSTQAPCTTQTAHTSRIGPTALAQRETRTRIVGVPCEHDRRGAAGNGDPAGRPPRRAAVAVGSARRGRGRLGRCRAARR